MTSSDQRPADPIIERVLGFSRSRFIASGRCVPPPIGCGAMNVGEFRDLKSLQEYRISGMCQVCQDKFFGV
jgi:hypothetical protein